MQLVERQDTHLGKMVVSAVFQKIRDGIYEPSILGTVPCTGTPIYVVTDEVLDEILLPYKSQIYYLGQVYRSKPKLPLWFKHFDKGPDGAGGLSYRYIRQNRLQEISTCQNGTSCLR